MDNQLLDIYPRELKFVFEVKKQSSCSVRLTNKTNQYVAYKVKTTSPKNYCVRPNIGIIKPKSTCDFVVTMQAPKSARSDMVCKDKFLVQSTVVPEGTTEGEVTSSMFTKDGVKYVEENKLKVILVSPPPSPVLSPVNGTMKQQPADDTSILKDSPVLSPVNGTIKQGPTDNTSILKDQLHREVENIIPHELIVENVVELKEENDEQLGPTKDSEQKMMTDMEEIKLAKDVEEMKLKLSQLEYKLKEAESTILKLTDERRSSSQERELLRQELAQLRTKKVVRRVQSGFPLLFVCMVALVSTILGYLLRR